MVALQLARRAPSLIFAVCILIRVARSQQSVCVNDLTNEDSCYNERSVICNNYTDVHHDCLPGTVVSLLYGSAKYTITHGSNLPYDENSYEVVALHLCHEKALEVTVSDLACGTKCTSEKDLYISNSFLFSCSNLSNLIKLGLTIVLLERAETPPCNLLKTKFVVIDTRGLKTITIMIRCYITNDYCRCK